MISYRCLYFLAIYSIFYIYECETVTWKWDKWWTYDGISGPDFWGLINPDWILCSKGRRQSPIDIDPSRLLYDPNLRHLHIDKHRVSGVIRNTGHSVEFAIEESKYQLNITGGPLSYKYKLTEAHLHYGLTDLQGSEHTINGRSFPAELQIFGFNAQLYYNFTHAIDKAYGIVGISMLLQLQVPSLHTDSKSDAELRFLTEGAQKIKYVGESATIEDISLHDLIPTTPYYLTYEGSTTTPACHETVTWILINKPAYITKQQLEILRKLRKVESSHSGEPTSGTPLANNFRPPQKLHHRPIRTNIDFTNAGRNCPSMHRELYYRANPHWPMS